MAMYGILGYPLGHSFSKGWFEAKGYEFQNFEFAEVEGFVEAMPEELNGFSVTIPHKQNIIPFLDRLDSVAAEVGAVNCVRRREGQLEGFNTDVIGFGESLAPLLKDCHKRAAVLGSGGASKAVVWALRSRGIECSVVSRTGDGYDYFDPSRVDIIVNTTPLGMYPKVEGFPPIDYSEIREHTICYDLVYNPGETVFMQLCRRRGAVVIGGIEMLRIQAEAALRLYEE